VRKPSNNTELDQRAMKALDDDLAKSLKVCRFLHLLKAMLTTLDLAAAGEDIYMTVGTTRNKSALVVSITWDGEKMAAYGDSALDLDAKMVSLLEDPPDPR